MGKPFEVDTNRDVSFEEYVPTDRYSLQDIYLHFITDIMRKYKRLLQQAYGGGMDTRALMDFYAEMRTFFLFAEQNYEEHLGKEDFGFLREQFTIGNYQMSIENADKIYRLLFEFGWKSGFTKLSEKKFMGSFAYARKELGIGGAKRVPKLEAD